MEYGKLDQTITSPSEISSLEDSQTFSKSVEDTISNDDSSVKLLDCSYMHSGQEEQLSKTKI